MKYKVGDYVLIKPMKLLYPCKIVEYIDNISFYAESKYFNYKMRFHVDGVLSLIKEEEYYFEPEQIKELYPEYFL